MAKRKRLGPAAMVAGAPETKSGIPTAPRAPIAQVSRDAAQEAALAEVTGALQAARDEGRLIQTLPLDQIQTDYLIRDRMVLAGEDMEALKTSLVARGQQQPIEVTQLAPDRYGLISGYRRITALRALSAEGAHDGTVLALIRQPGDMAQAYCAMIEENEIRVGLSYYERANIVDRAVKAGLFETDKKALQALFASASRAKRSKIKSFLPVVRDLGSVLRFPTAIGERLGLDLAAAMAGDETLPIRLKAALGPGADSAEAEAEILRQGLAPARPARPADMAASDPGPKSPAGEVLQPGLRLEAKRGRVVLSGERVTEHLITRLRHWLETREG